MLFHNQFLSFVPASMSSKRKNAPYPRLPTPGTSNSISREKKSSFPPSVKNPDKSAVLVFYCSHNKTHKPSSLKERKFIIFKFCGSEAQHRCHGTKIKVTRGLCFFLKALQNHLYLFQTLEVNHFPWFGPLPPSSKPAVAVISPCIVPFISF